MGCLPLVGLAFAALVAAQFIPKLVGLGFGILVVWAAKGATTSGKRMLIGALGGIWTLALLGQSGKRSGADSSTSAPARVAAPQPAPPPPPKPATQPAPAAKPASPLQELGFKKGDLKPEYQALLLKSIGLDARGDLTLESWTKAREWGETTAHVVKTKAGDFFALEIGRITKEKPDPEEATGDLMAPLWVIDDKPVRDGAMNHMLDSMKRGRMCTAAAVPDKALGGFMMHVDACDEVYIFRAVRK